MASEPALDEKVVAVSAGLTAAGIPHAFGGALALAYYAEPRATIDIDLNVFAAADAPGPVLDALTGIGVEVGKETPGAIANQGQVRLAWDRTPLDLFFSTHPFHDACARGCRHVPFGDATIPVLAAEHLVVFKALYDRRKDWIDIEQVLFLAGADFDAMEAERWLIALIGGEDARVRRLTSLVAAFGADAQ